MPDLKRRDSSGDDQSECAELQDLLHGLHAPGPHFAASWTITSQEVPETDPVVAGNVIEFTPPLRFKEQIQV